MTEPNGVVAVEQQELNLLPGDTFAPQRPRLWKPAAGSLLVHAAAAVVLLSWPATTPPRRSAPELIANLHRATPLVAPPELLTQRAPNTGKPSQEVNLEGLLSRPMLRQPPGPPATMRPAAPRQIPQMPLPAAGQTATATKPIPPPPQVDPQTSDLAQLPPGELPHPGSATLPPPPQIQMQERPKLAFESPGASAGAPSPAAAPKGAVPVPRAGVQEAVRSVVRGGGSGGLVVGDIGIGAGGLGDALNRAPSPGRNASSLELMSDPMGVDFRPYLIRILSTVRRNWFAVIPESARMGRRGKVQIQFAVSRDGSVPKLVIAMGSGTEALDRAAVAGISASNPFPPLPGEFPGQQIRLQFTFLYNMPSQ